VEAKWRAGQWSSPSEGAVVVTRWRAGKGQGGGGRRGYFAKLYLLVRRFSSGWWAGGRLETMPCAGQASVRVRV